MNVGTYIKENHYEDAVKDAFSRIDNSERKMAEARERYDSKTYESAQDEKQKAQFDLGMIYIKYAEDLRNNGRCPVNDIKFLEEARNAAM